MKFIEVSLTGNEDEDKLVSLDKYIEDLEYFYNIYSASDDNKVDMAEELMMYEYLISWLKELKHYREKEKTEQDMKE